MLPTAVYFLLCLNADLCGWITEQARAGRGPWACVSVHKVFSFLLQMETQNYDKIKKNRHRMKKKMQSDKKDTKVRVYKEI